MCCTSNCLLFVRYLRFDTYAIIHNIYHYRTLKGLVQLIYFRLIDYDRLLGHPNNARQRPLMVKKILHILLLPTLSIIPDKIGNVTSIKNTAIKHTGMNINLLVTSEAWSWSALGPRIQEKDCAASGTGAPHLWAPGPGRTPPLRAKQPGGSGAKPYSLSTSARTASTPPYWQKRRRIMAKWKLEIWQPGARKWSAKIADVKLTQFHSAVQRALNRQRSILWGIVSPRIHA